tara:strand:- start:255 stop:686 length:432 start_codon:yes stop_codon:yes gene_type:complete
MLKKEIKNILNKNNIILFNYIAKKHIIKIVVDTVDGIDIKMITKISKLIKNSNIVNLEYPNGVRIEVSSPGLDQPLQKIFQYKRNINKKIKVFLKDKEEINNPIIGVLNIVNDDNILIKNKNGFFKLMFNQIEKSFLQIEINK